MVGGTFKGETFVPSWTKNNVVNDSLSRDFYMDFSHYAKVPVQVEEKLMKTRVKNGVEE